MLPRHNLLGKLTAITASRAGIYMARKEHASVASMKTRATILTLLLTGACGGHHGTLRVDSPVTPYEKPDISEITGIDEDDTSSSDETEKPAAPAPAPAPAKK